MAITIEDLRTAGYDVSTLKSQAAIDLAEKDVKLAYFPTSEAFSDESVKQLLYSLIFAALLRRRIVATRYGANIKNAQYSAQAEDEAITREIRGYCAQRLEAYATTKSFEYNDILKIFDTIGFL